MSLRQRSFTETAHLDDAIAREPMAVVAILLSLRAFLVREPLVLSVHHSVFGPLNRGEIERLLGAVGDVLEADRADRILVEGAWAAGETVRPALETRSGRLTETEYRGLARIGGVVVARGDWQFQKRHAVADAHRLAEVANNALEARLSVAP